MFGFEWVTSPEAWIALLTLTALEIVLGIDNIIFISILVGRLPEHQRQRARMQGLGLAMFTRIALLLSLAWVMRLTEPLFIVLGQEISGRDVILIGGALFLLFKSTHEIHNSLEGVEESQQAPVVAGLVGATAAFVFMGFVWDVDTAYGTMAWQLGLLGFGLGLVTAPTSAAVVDAAPADRRDQDRPQPDYQY